MAYTTIDDPTIYFNTKLYAGNSTGSTQQAISGVGFSPDMVWIAPRTDSEKHSIADTVRGTTKTIHPNDNSAEETSAGHMVSFDSDGFTVGVDNYSWNKSGSNFVSWNWKAGTTSGISGSPSITPASYSFNSSAGFSIIKWTGTGANATLPHGLGVAPALIIIKNLDGGHWRVYHHKNTSAPETDFLELSTENATSDNNTAFNDTAPTSTLFSVGSMDETNKNTENMIAYCMAEKQGYFKAGSYTGTGLSGIRSPFIYLGFKPALIIIKKTSASPVRGWVMEDNKRSQNGDTRNNKIEAGGDSTSSGDAKDFLSNGFHLYDITGDWFNASGVVYAYMAWAESPFTNSSGVPNNAK